MAVRDDRGDVKQTTRGFRGPLMVQSLTSAKSKFLSLQLSYGLDYRICWILGTSYGVTANFAGQKLLIFNKP